LVGISLIWKVIYDSYAVYRKSKEKLVYACLNAVFIFGGFGWQIVILVGFSVEFGICGIWLISGGLYRCSSMPVIA
jgi:hypothetical protein